MIKEPTETDFDVKADGLNFLVTFKPTGALFEFIPAGSRIDRGTQEQPTIITLPNGDAYWSNAVEAAAKRQAEGVLAWHRRRRLLIGAVVGMICGAGYFAILPEPPGPHVFYQPRTIGEHVVQLIAFLTPWALIGAAIGFFTGRKRVMRR